MPPRHAFTLIELLITISIIAVLLGLLMPALGYARLLARSTVTSQRCDDIVRALAGLATREESPAHLLHQRLAPHGVPGVTLFKRDAYWGELFPREGAWIPAPYPAWCFAHPWGKVPTDLPGDAPASLPPAPQPIEAHRLSNLSPAFTVAILTAAGLMESSDPVAAYRSNRDRQRPWNDAWGNPLVVATGLYHPRRNTAISLGEREEIAGGNAFQYRVRQDLFVKRAQSSYGYAKAFYISVGSIGTGPEAPLSRATLADPTADWDDPGTGQLAELWRQINAVCNDDGSGNDLWTSAGDRNPFADPPWTGVKRGKRDGRYAFLSAPVELR